MFVCRENRLAVDPVTSTPSKRPSRPGSPSSRRDRRRSWHAATYRRGRRQGVAPGRLEKLGECETSKGQMCHENQEI